jgi:hypothetical protein
MRKMILTAVVSVGIASNATAQTFGDWFVLERPNPQGVCVMTTRTSSGVSIAVTAQRNGDQPWIGFRISNPVWNVRGNSNFEIQFAGGTAFFAVAAPIRTFTDSYQNDGLRVTIPLGERRVFFENFMQKSTVTVKSDEVGTHHFSLKGSARATQVFSNCVDMITSRAPSPAPSVPRNLVPESAAPATSKSGGFSI